MLRNALMTLSAALLVAQVPTTTNEPQNASQARPVVKTGTTPDQVIGRLGTRSIRESDFEAFMAIVLNSQQRQAMEGTPGGRERAKKQYLDFQVMEAEARKDGLNKTETFKKQRELMESQLLIQALMKRDGPLFKKGGEVEDKDVKAYFDTHLDQFKRPESFSARHILVSVKGAPNAPASALSEDEAKAKAMLASKALGEGKGWEAVAREFSDDPGSKEKGGLYENVSYGAFIPEFEAAVRKQDVGKVGDPVKSKFGYHVIQVERRVPGGTPDFDTVKEQVKKHAQAVKQDEAFQAYLDGIKKDLGWVEGSVALKALNPKVKPAASPKRFRSFANE